MLGQRSLISKVYRGEGYPQHVMLVGIPSGVELSQCSVVKIEHADYKEYGILHPQIQGYDGEEILYIVGTVPMPNSVKIGGKEKDFWLIPKDVEEYLEKYF